MGRCRRLRSRRIRWPGQPPSLPCPPHHWKEECRRYQRGPCTCRNYSKLPFPSEADRTNDSLDCNRPFRPINSLRHQHPGFASEVTSVKTFSLVVFLALMPAVAVGAGLPRSSPEGQGVSSADLLAFVNAADKIDSMNSFMLVRHGQVVAEGWWTPYEAQAPHELYSLSKSFTSTGIGLLISQGKLSLDDEVLKFFPEEAPARPSANLKAMRVRDLLCMSTGHQTEPPRPAHESWVRAFLAHPVPFKPGTHFLYNTSATYMLSTI